MTEMTALKFYKAIEDEQESYRLVNGLFIVKYEENNLISRYVGEFLKGGTALNNGKRNMVITSGRSQLFYKKMNATTTGLGKWKKLDIKFEEQPIKEILK